VREWYDLIILDSPPLLPGTDAAPLAWKTDGAILVVRHSRTRRYELSHAAERLRAVEAERPHEEAAGSSAHDPAANKTTGKRSRERGFVDDVLQ
jgi:hypothetical protein